VATVERFRKFDDIVVDRFFVCRVNNAERNCARVDPEVTGTFPLFVVLLMRHYLVSFAATAATAAVGGAASIQAQSFYSQLQKPDWAPPSAVFGPVWTVLYILIAIAGGMAMAKATPGRRLKLGGLFLAQLGLNALWSWLFFAWRQGGLAFADIVLLAATIIVLIACFWRVSRTAALLMLPYLLWVCFAAALNLTVWQLNASVL
jgi:tryptophan-rich sensory protein